MTDDDPWELEYWTTSTCATCGIDGWNLTNARMAGISVRVRIVDRLPDPTVDRAGIKLPFFTDLGHRRFWPKIRNYLQSVKGGDDDGDNGGTVQP